MSAAVTLPQPPRPHSVTLASYLSTWLLQEIHPPFQGALLSFKASHASCAVALKFEARRVATLLLKHFHPVRTTSFLACKDSEILGSGGLAGHLPASCRRVHCSNRRLQLASPASVCPPPPQALRLNLVSRSCASGDQTLEELLTGHIVCHIHLSGRHETPKAVQAKP